MKIKTIAIVATCYRKDVMAVKKAGSYGFVGSGRTYDGTDIISSNSEYELLFNFKRIDAAKRCFKRIVETNKTLRVEYAEGFSKNPLMPFAELCALHGMNKAYELYHIPIDPSGTV